MRVLATGQPHVMAVQKYDIRRPDSEGGGFEERYWSPLNAPVLGRNGEVAYIIHQVEDVTAFVRLKQQGAAERKVTEELRTHAARMEATLQATARYRALMEQANDAILILDLAGTILEANRESERLFGRVRSEIVGRNYDDFVVPEERADSAQRRKRLEDRK